MRNLILAVFLSIMLPSLVFSADIATVGTLGTAASGDAIIAVDASAAAGSRMKRIVLDGDAAKALSGAGTMVTIPTKATLGLDTDDNVAFSTINITGGSLSFNNSQVVAKWVAGVTYQANVNAVIYGGKIYICKAGHLAASETEPGVGGLWENAWTEFSGSGASTLGALTDITGEGTADYILYDDGDGTFSFRAAPSGSVPAGTDGQIVGYVGTTPTAIDNPNVISGDNITITEVAGDYVINVKNTVALNASFVSDAAFALAFPNLTFLKTTDIASKSLLEAIVGEPLGAELVVAQVADDPTIASATGMYVSTNTTDGNSNVFFIVDQGESFTALTGTTTFADRTPTDFVDFTPYIDATLSQANVVSASTYTVLDVDPNTPISVEAGLKYNINGGTYTATAGTVDSTDVIGARMDFASDVNSTAIVKAMTIGTETANFSVTTEAEPAATADYEWPMLDNASNATITGTVGGVNGTLSGTGATTAGVQTGTGFYLAVGSVFPYVPTSTLGSVGDSLTIQATFESVSSTPPNGSACYIIGTGLNIALRLNFGGADNVTLYMNGASQGNITGFNLDDDSAHVVRMVYNSTADTVALYWGASEGGLSLFHTWTSVPAPTSLGSYLNIANNWLGNISDLKVWNSVVTP